MRLLINYYVEEPDLVKSADVSPIFMTDFGFLPKCLIVNAELDLLKDAARVYHEKLVANGSSSELVEIKGALHGFFSTGTAYKNAFEQAAGCVIDFLSKI